MSSKIWSCIAFAVPVAASAIDLTPTHDYRLLEGVKIPTIKFENNEPVIQWRPPSGWRVSYKDGILRAFRKDAARSSLEVRSVARSPEDQESLANPAAIKAFCAKMLPETATGVAFRSSVAGSFNLGRAVATEYLCSFAEEGQEFMAAVCVVNTSETERVVAVISAPSQEFESVREAGIKSFFTWQSR